MRHLAHISMSTLSPAALGNIPRIIKCPQTMHNENTGTGAKKNIINRTLYIIHEQQMCWNQTSFPIPIQPTNQHIIPLIYVYRTRAGKEETKKKQLHKWLVVPYCRIDLETRNTHNSHAVIFSVAYGKASPRNSIIAQWGSHTRTSVSTAEAGLLSNIQHQNTHNALLWIIVARRNQSGIVPTCRLHESPVHE